jgi:hypothetical protein
MMVIHHYHHLFISFQHSLLDGSQVGSNQPLGTPSNNFYTQPHCSYLDIYISQNARLCKGDFEGKFQLILQAECINFFIRFITFIFLLVFTEFVKSTDFYTLLLLFQRVDMFELCFDAKMQLVSYEFEHSYQCIKPI